MLTLSIIVVFATMSKGAAEELNAEDEVVQMEVTVEGTSQVLDPVARPLNSPEFRKRKESQKKRMEIIAEAERRRLVASGLTINLNYDTVPRNLRGKTVVDLAATATVGDLRKTAEISRELSLWSHTTLLAPESLLLADTDLDPAGATVHASLYSNFALWTRSQSNPKLWNLVIQRDEGGFYKTATKKIEGTIAADKDVEQKLKDFNKILRGNPRVKRITMTPSTIDAKTQEVSIAWEVAP